MSQNKKYWVKWRELHSYEYNAVVFAENEDEARKKAFDNSRNGAERDGEWVENSFIKTVKINKGKAKETYE